MARGSYRGRLVKFLTYTCVMTVRSVYSRGFLHATLQHIN